MANLNGQNIGTNYKGFLNLDSTINTPLDATLRAVTDGMGNSSVLQLSTAAIGLGSTSIWDNTNGRLGIGTTTPTSALNFGVSSYITYNNTSSNSYIGEFGINNSLGLQITGNNPIRFLTDSTERMRILGNGNTSIGSSTDLGATVGIKGLGATSATTSLLVQNSAGSAALTINDARSVGIHAQTQVCFSIDGAPNNNNGLRILSTSFTGAFSYFDGYSDGSSKGANYPMVFGSRCNNLGSDISNVTTQENGTPCIFGSAVNFASAQVIINSTTRGFLPPRMTTTQKNAISTPATGLVVYDNTLNKLAVYTGAAWETVTSL